MSFVVELSTNKHVIVKFNEKSSPMNKNKSFVYDIERLFNNYIDIDKAGILVSRLSRTNTRYSFFRNYAISQTVYADDEFITNSDIDEYDFLDNAITALTCIITLHSICWLKPNEYNELYTRSANYSEFINNYIIFIKEWVAPKSIASDVNELISTIEANFKYLDPLLVNNMQVFSVFEDYDYTPNRTTSSYGYALAAVIAILIILMLIWIYFKFIR